jgi:lipopolysaccharide transport system permease protein
MNPHKGFPTSIFSMLMSLRRNRQLITQMTKREIIGRYKGSVLGIAWSFFNPVLMLVIYTFVFSVVFKAHWGIGADESKSDFAIVLFVGMIIHGLFAECVNRAPGLILSNINYVKKVVFPLEVLPWIAMGSALFHTIISLIILFAAQLIINHYLPWTALFFPLAILPLILATMGFAWFLSAIGVYVRDIGQITGIFTTVMLFISPIFYPISALPKEFQSWIQCNPLTFILEEGRNTLIFGHMPNWTGLSVALAVGLLVALGGFWWFQKTRKGFADVL